MNNILNIVENKRCTGCSLCSYSCPKQIISLKQNESGFYVATINKLEECLNCGICLKCCCANKEKINMPLTAKSVYYGWNDETRENGTSGGVVSEIYSHYLNTGGVVFGAYLDKNDWKLSHKKIDSIDELKTIAKSKYLQSDMGDTLKQIKNLLDKKRKVVFCGTPCQVYAVRTAFIHQQEQLILVDFICHGVPSQNVFNDYISSLEKKRKSEIIEYEFRSKARGWSHITIGAEFANGEKINLRGQLDEYYYLFSNSISLNNACYECPFRKVHFSDLSVADYWGIFGNVEAQKTIDCVEKGISLISVWTDLGKEVIDELTKNSNTNHFVSLPSAAASYTLEDLEDKNQKKKYSEKFYKDYNAYGYTHCIKKYANNLKVKIVKQYIKNFLNKK